MILATAATLAKQSEHRSKVQLLSTKTKPKKLEFDALKEEQGRAWVSPVF